MRPTTSLRQFGEIFLRRIDQRHLSLSAPSVSPVRWLAFQPLPQPVLQPVQPLRQMLDEIALPAAENLCHALHAARERRLQLVQFRQLVIKLMGPFSRYGLPRRLLARAPACARTVDDQNRGRQQHRQPRARQQQVEHAHPPTAEMKQNVIHARNASAIRHHNRTKSERSAVN